jgi:DNA polymerase
MTAAAMPNLFWDAETRSALDLGIAGAWRYAGDPSTEVLCVGFAVDDGEPQIWIPGEPIPEPFIAAVRDSSWRAVAHNYQFERAIATRILEPRHGLPRIPLAQQCCTMTLALANALPGELEAAALALGLPYEKDREGYRLMRQMARPRRRRKGEDPNGIYWVDSPELRKRNHKYCMRDIEVIRALFHRVPLLPPKEQEYWQFDAIINERGFYVDRVLVKATRDLAQAEQAAINTEIAKYTDDEITSVNQRDRIVAFVRRHGHTLQALTKRSVTAALAAEPNDLVRRVLELRQEGARASVRKFDRLLASLDADSRLRGSLRFMGSSTGRWSGRGYQPQNLKKSETKDINAAVDAIIAGDAGRVRELGAPLTIASDVSRAMICAAPDYTLIGGDFSAIESRALAWVADEEWKLQNYRDYDATGRPVLEPYCATASRLLKRTVTPEDEAGRAIGKTADLALGYGGALGAWRRFNPDDTRPDGEILLNIQEWRRTHSNIVKFWRRYESACLRTVRTKQPTELVGRYTRFAFAFENNTLFVTLPSGRRLAYPEARIGPSKFEDRQQVYFKDNARGGWTDCGAWYGTFVENAVQALSRDLLAAAIQRLEAAGYQIVLHVHDEIVCEIPEGFGSTAEFHALMTQLPSWADTLPIAAKVWISPRYIKSKDAIAAKPESAVDIFEADGKTSPIAAAPTLVSAPDPAEDDENGPDWVNIPLADIIGEPLVDGMVSCPFHDDQTPSCRIYEDHFHCFGCGAHGNHLDWLMQVEGIERGEARDMLETWDGPRQIQPRDDGEAKRAYALELWEGARPLAGTLAARYLSDTRKIDLAALPANIDSVLRFHPRCPFGTGIYNPCLLALMRNALTDAPIGIQRIALTPDAQKIDRRMLGKQGVVKLWPPGSQLVIGEGLETVLAAATRIPYEDAPLRPAWAALSAEGLGQFPVVTGVERLIILVDNDPTGKTAASYCAGRWECTQRNVIQLTPDEPGFDFNDLIMAE